MFGWFRKGSAGKPAAEPEATLDLAHVIPLHLAGELEPASEGYQTLISQASHKAASEFLLAIVLVQQGRLNEALLLLHDLAEQSGAVSAEIQAVAAKDDFSSLQALMLSAGDALKRAGRAELSCVCYQVAAEIGPNRAEALYRCGDTLHDLRMFHEAEQALQAALAVDPEHWGACYTCGVLNQDLGRDAEAIGYYERALRLRDGHGKLHNNLGSALLNTGRKSEALPHFQRAVELDPRLPHAHANLGTVYNLLGDVPEALAAFEKAIALGAPAGNRVKHALVMPAVPASNEEILEARNRLQSAFREMSTQRIFLGDPVREVGLTPFYLAYHGLNDLPLMRQIAQFYTEACPALSHVAPHCTRSAGSDAANRKIRVGFVSTFLHEHTVGRYFHQVIRKLSRERFEVVAISNFAKEDQITRGIVEAADQAIKVPMLLSEAQRAIGDARLDVLVYCDIGMEPLTYFLGFARLAPVQIALYGHPVTTGIPNIDYFLSHQACEPPEAAQHYSERLLCLGKEVAYTYFDRPAAGAPKSRADFLLDDAAHLYLCPQSLFKIHPEMDGLFARILEADPAGLLLLCESGQPEWDDRMRQRLQRTGDPERIRFVPRLAHGDFLELLRLADVILDTVHFSGGATTFDSLAMGTPIVTMPGLFMRGRQTLACYRSLGIDDCIAGSAAEYVEIAVRIGSDRQLRSDLSSRILDAAPRLFEDIGMIREFEQLLEGVVRQ